MFTLNSATESSVDYEDIQQNGVLKLLKSSKTHKVTGPDGISARFIKEFFNKIAPALSLPCRKFLKQGTLPQD